MLATRVTAILCLSGCLFAQDGALGDLPTTAAERDERMAWWREARFGMFIHWGVYSVPAGIHDGERVNGIGEWIMQRAKIPVVDYRSYAQRFNPVKYDADAWARLAKAAGMRYVVITSKHHDGFALFDSAVTDWDVVDATPYGKDLLRPLVEACKKHGLKIGFYYSQAQDWTHVGGSKRGYDDGDGWDPAHRGSFDEYLARIAQPQVREILTGYDIDLIWWDTPHLMTQERAEKLRPLLKLRPGILSNNRLVAGDKGDFSTPEQHIPATGLDSDWETCMTMNDTWGYKSYDGNWKSTETLVRNLVDAASKGGNYLLNVGPTALGEFPEPSVERLREIGRWMDTNGDSIYGTTASPFSNLSWGRCTKKVTDGSVTLYLHVFDWPTSGELRLIELRSEVVEAKLMATGDRLSVARGRDGLVINVPPTGPDPIDNVIVLKVRGELDVRRMLPRQDKAGVVTLLAAIGDLHTPPYAEPVSLMGSADKRFIGNWGDARNWVEWRFEVSSPGEFEVIADVATTASRPRISVSVSGHEIHTSLPDTGGERSYVEVKLGRITLKGNGTQTLAIKPKAEGWSPIALRRVTLRPVD